MIRNQFLGYAAIAAQGGAMGRHKYAIGDVRRAEIYGLKQAFEHLVRGAYPVQFRMCILLEIMKYH